VGRRTRERHRAIRLSPLSPEETATLFDALFAGSAAPQGVDADLLERAGGNPFYAEEFARMVLDGRSDRDLPQSVQGLIAARPPRWSGAVREGAVAERGGRGEGVLDRVPWVGQLSIEDLEDLVSKTREPLPSASSSQEGTYAAAIRP
jgi:hypothetical protein